MPADLISKKTRLELREYFVGTSLREIKSEFDAADIEADLNYEPAVGGQRRTLIEQYYHTIDWAKWSDIRKFVTVYESVLNTVEDSEQQGQEWAAKTFRSLKKWIERDGFAFQSGRLTVSATNHGLEQITDAVRELDLPELHRQIRRMQAAVESDPALAIGTAKELVESTCKTILEARQLHYVEDADIGQLVKETRKALGLIPESVPNAAKGSESIRRLLSNLGNVAQGLGELRNLYGTGHGKGGGVRGLGPRHARLAVGAAATLATFLLETHLERSI